MTHADELTERPSGTPTVQVCPADECGSPDIYPRRPSMPRLTDNHAYRCFECGHLFDRPAERDRKHAGVCLRGDTLARRLHEADPDEVGP